MRDYVILITSHRIELRNSGSELSSKLSLSNESEVLIEILQNIVTMLLDPVLLKLLL